MIGRMLRLLLVSAFALAVHAPDAAARDCQELHRVFPSDGARDVPTNSSVWIFGDEQKAYMLDDGISQHPVGHSVWSTPRITRLNLGSLAPHHVYTVRTIAGEHVTTFTTGEHAATSRPVPPDLKRVRAELGRLSISAESNANVAVWVRTWRLGDVHVPWAWQLFPADGFDTAFETCNQVDRHAPGSVCAELRSVDIAGNASMSVSNCTPLPADPSWVRPNRPRTKRHFVAVMLIGLGILSAVGLLALRRRVCDVMAR